ncbi:hypothetical protein RN001_007884 [Aquatica leii]|uniref:Uncharacterized protein n=1 Tax=Aquatica leii TaxID=1421715 RepID=A0AAN7QIN1_9COLE|nr:hypothetical protein RN001_007884 [Aquatica leii]
MKLVFIFYIALIALSCVVSTFSKLCIERCECDLYDYKCPKQYYHHYYCPKRVRAKGGLLHKLCEKLCKRTHDKYC